MGTTQAQFRADLRRDLRDEDATAYVWTDAVLNRHIQRAVQEVQRVAPRFAYLTKVAPSPAARRIDLTADVPAAFLFVDAVEHPLDLLPQRFIPFQEEPGPKVYLLIATPPPAGESLRVWYGARYAVDESSSDLPLELDMAVLVGAAAFACADQAVDVVDKLTPRESAPAYRALAQAHRARFAEMLRDLRTRHATPRWRIDWRIAADA